MTGTKTLVMAVRRFPPPKMQMAVTSARAAPAIRGVRLSKKPYPAKESTRLKDATRLKPTM